MSSLNAADIQGFVLRGYNLPYARYLFLEISQDNGRQFLSRLTPQITTGELWDEKPRFTVNIAFTHKGLVNLNLPILALRSFPSEFVQGMKERAAILHDTGKNSSEHWDLMWNEEQVHAWLSVNGRSETDLDQKCAELQELMQETGGAVVIGSQDACAIVIDGHPTSMEHFGYTQGFGNPDYLGVARNTGPGQGKLLPDGSWGPLATGELLLGYCNEAGSLPDAPVPKLLAKNGSFMVYRKLHQNVAAFRRYLDEKSRLYSGGREKLASKLVGRWRDGTPVELSPHSPDQTIVRSPDRNMNFNYSRDLSGSRCPIGAHIRRGNPRDAFGFNGALVNRRRISRRGIPYGQYVPEGLPVRDEDERGMIFIALNASISSQFEYVCQQWIEYGNDSRQGNDKDPLAGNHEDRGRFIITGTEDPSDPPFVCGNMPNFVEVRGGDYFFVPSITALGMIAAGTIDPR